jgi:sarcosine oxidase
LPHNGLAVHASDGRHSVDRVVVAAGRGTMELAAQVGVYLPTALAHHARFTSVRALGCP